MLRRLLLTALLAALAVALPAAAEEDPSFGLPPGSDPWGCLPSDLSCQGVLDACDALLGPCWPDQSGSSSLGVGQTAESVDCRPWDLNNPNTNTSIWETLIVDPDGCLRSFIRRTIDELPPSPPVEMTVDAVPAPVIHSLLPWT